MAKRCVWVRVPALILLAAAWGAAGEHPALGNNATCVDCHADKTAGPVVHPPVMSGCDSCHQVERRERTANISLVRPLSSLCFPCHHEESYTHQHFPYVGGMCTRCHNPHTSKNPRLLIASVNDLCLRCHLLAGGPGEPGQPMIWLDESKATGHPIAKHPVSGKTDPLRHREMDCTSCHMPHGSSKKHLIKVGLESPGDLLNRTVETQDICSKCHEVLPPSAADEPRTKQRKGKKRH